MNVQEFSSYEEMANAAALMIVEKVKEKPDALLCFAGGNTPLGVFKELIRLQQAGAVSFSGCRFVGLDEWIGLDGQDEGSCKYTLDIEFFKPAGIREAKIKFFDGKSTHLENECRRMDSYINGNGGIDLILLGIGVNGHLGFNEPGTSFQLSSHVTELDETTMEVGQKYFPDEMKLSKGITLGPKMILTSQTAILIANGEEKRQAIENTLYREVDEHFPSTLLRAHQDSYVFYYF